MALAPVTFLYSELPDVYAAYKTYNGAHFPPGGPQNSIASRCNGAAGVNVLWTDTSGSFVDKAATVDEFFHTLSASMQAKQPGSSITVAQNGHVQWWLNGKLIGDFVLTKKALTLKDPRTGQSYTFPPPSASSTSPIRQITPANVGQFAVCKPPSFLKPTTPAPTTPPPPPTVTQLTDALAPIAPSPFVAANFMWGMNELVKKIVPNSSVKYITGGWGPTTVPDPLMFEWRKGDGKLIGTFVIHPKQTAWYMVTVLETGQMYDLHKLAAQYNVSLLS